MTSYTPFSMNQAPNMKNERHEKNRIIDLVIWFSPTTPILVYDHFNGF